MSEAVLESWQDAALPSGTRKVSGAPVRTFAELSYSSWGKLISEALGGSVFFTENCEQIRGVLTSEPTMEPVKLAKQLTKLIDQEPVEVGQPHDADAVVELLASSQDGIRQLAIALSDHNLAPYVFLLLARVPAPQKLLVDLACSLLHSRRLAVRAGAVRCLEAWGTAQGRPALESAAAREEDAWLNDYLRRIIQ